MYDPVQVFFHVKDRRWIRWLEKYKCHQAHRRTVTSKISLHWYELGRAIVDTIDALADQCEALYKPTLSAWRTPTQYALIALEF